MKLQKRSANNFSLTFDHKWYQAAAHPTAIKAHQKYIFNARNVLNVQVSNVWRVVIYPTRIHPPAISQAITPE